MDDIDAFDLFRLPTPVRPLLGLTVLVVEDSRFACEALRLLCLRSGARIRRADCLASARRHLQVYRPSVVIVDLGLPDGPGTDLIEELHRANPRVGVILGTSGDDFAADRAIAAGADGFLAKPATDLAAFQEAVLSHLPADRQPGGPRMINHEIVEPDRIAYRDDMAHAADVLNDGSDDQSIDYVAQFLEGVARSAEDRPLMVAAQSLAMARANGTPARMDIARIAGLIQERLNHKIAI
ncbi:response regulator [Mesobacterium pallidum]|uniref:response regulator n=1 Tax=Mesobacterium pallidum TaxID=2872037 RepID=UPI001EE17BF9|nr:response regulator [Mesobacterium pallidum]